MNYLRVHAAAKKRVKARKDILGLLKNGKTRRTKKKTHSPFVRRPFGIFGRAISFKVILGGASQSNSNKQPSQRVPDEILVVPIRRVHVLKPANTKAKSTSKNVHRKRRSKGGGKEFDEQDVIPTQKVEEQQKNSPTIVFRQTERSARDAEPTQSFMDSNVPIGENRNKQSRTKTASSTIKHIQRHQTANYYASVEDNDQSNTLQTPVEFSLIAESPANDPIPHEILSFDSLIESDSENVSQVSSAVTSQVEQSSYVSNNESQTSNFLDFAATQSDNGQSDENLTQSTDSGWSLETPAFTDRSHSPSNGSLLPDEVEIVSQSTYDELTPTDSSEDQTNFYDFECQSLTRPQSQSPMDKPKFTMEMLMERKALAARRALALIFPTNTGSITSMSSQSKFQTQNQSKISTFNTSVSSFKSRFEGTKVTQDSFGSSLLDNWRSKFEAERRSNEQSQFTTKTMIEPKRLASLSTNDQRPWKKANPPSLAQNNSNDPQYICSTNYSHLRAQRPKNFTRIPWCGERTFLQTIVK